MLGPSPLCFSPLCCLFKPREAPVMSTRDGRLQEKDPNWELRLSNLLCASGQVASLLWALVSSSVKCEDLVT